MEAREKTNGECQKCFPGRIQVILTLTFAGGHPDNQQTPKNQKDLPYTPRKQAASTSRGGIQASGP